ncbi:hypothetical protein Bca52824_096341 [Brassica carinata]|uniref:Protein kinase domain-containing protein n=1 Tax=Brassica carinata TaxID=52824 RepID=A0A8X7TH28_BRACI|nr:hypothetical protein Bca52824_096341 [Brassica carinata]
MSINMRTLTQALAKTAAVIEKTVQTTVQEVTGPKPLQDYELLYQIGSGGPGLAWKLYSAKARDSTRPQQYPTVCVWLVRLRHPGVVHVVQALDENKNAMAMVTEPLFASVANALGDVENVDNVPKDLKSMEMSLLEVKHGLLQMAETLNFLHNNAHLIHRAVSPENVLITSAGSWKFAGFGFAISEAQAGNLDNMQSFHYYSILPLQPSLNYTAPELVRSKTPSAGASSDIFSFGCLAYHLVARKPLFDCHNNVKMYMNTLNYLTNETFSSIPSDLVSDLQRMLSTNESFRPTALDFTGSNFFRSDTRLRALRFLDHMLERDNMQKSEFLKALSDMWKDFDSRVLRYKVLPPLCAELRNLVMQPVILPMVLTIAESQDKNDFELTTLPALVPVLSSATGDTLLLLVKRADLIINKTNTEHLASHILPLLLRAYNDNDVRIQEEVLKRSTSLAKQLDGQVVRQAILPRVHGLALKTTVAAVRQSNALLCLAELVQALDKHAVTEILQTIQRCTAVDRSAPTLMCTSCSRKRNSQAVEFTAEHVLPLIIPLLTAQQLNVQQFAKYMLFVKDILRKIEEKRGVTVNDSGVPEVKPGSVADGIQFPTPTQKLRRTAVPTTCPPVDIEWPPRQPSNVTSSQPANDEARLNSGGTSSTPSFDELDPLLIGHHELTVRPLLLGFPQRMKQFPTANNDFWAFGNASVSSQGVQVSVQECRRFGSSSYSKKPPADISSIFKSSKTEQAAMRLAPPPSTAVKWFKQQQTEQPSLLDLL